MSLTRCFVGVLFVALITGNALANPVARAQLREATWESLETLPKGSIVRLVFKDECQVQGRLVQVRSDSVMLQENDTRQTGTRPACAPLRDRSTFLRADIVRVAVMSETFQAATTQATEDTEVPHRSWVSRHPVATGALIGSAYPLVGTGIGACTAHLISAKQKTYDAPVSRQPDIRAVKRLVAVLGVGKQISATKANGDMVTGTIGGIEGKQFSIVPDGQIAAMTIAYAEIQSVKGKPPSTGAKVGITACVVVPIVAFGLWRAFPGQ